MRKFYLSTLVLTLCITGRIVSAQDFSNKGRDFWLGYGYHQLMSGNSQNMVLYFATDTFSATTVTVDIPGIGWTQTYANIGPNTVFETPPLPKNAPQDARLITEGLFDLGIHITSDKPIVAYSHVYSLNVSGASILFPTPTLGKEYYSINFTNMSNTGNANCWFYVVATDTGTTTVEITPTGNTIGGWSAGNTYTVTLLQNQIYNVMGQYSGNSGVDLTGSYIKSVSTAGGACKRIAVFSGSGRISITCNGSPASSDYYMTQAFPKTAWGKRFLTIPTGGAMQNNFFRICVSNPATNVLLNGFPIPYPLQAGFYYEIPASQTPYYIEGDQPMCVAQYVTSQGNCGNGTPGDPEVIYLSPVEQNIDKITFNSTPNTPGNITQHFYNVIIPNTGTAISSFRRDGVAPPAGSWIVHPANPGYSYLREAISAGPHTIRSDSGFNAIAYGFGNAESYGYNAGTNIKDIFQFITLQNPGATVNIPATCQNVPIYFAMTFPYQPTEIRWIFGPTLNAMGIADTTLYNPVFDSSYVVQGKTLYRYKLPSAYTIPTAGTYQIKVVALNPTPDGCGGIQEILFDLVVYPPPVAEFNFTSSGCITDTVDFFDNPQNTSGRPIINWFWDFADGNTATTQNAQHLYTAPGVYNVVHRITTDVGCISPPLTHPVTINNPPVASFTASTPRCIGTPITFTNSSTAPPGVTIGTWEWDFGDGSPVIIATTGANQTHTYNTGGLFTATLTVTSTTGCESLVFQYPVTIHVNPVAGFTFPNICMPAGASQFTNTTTISDGTLPTVTYLWDFGDGNTSTATNPLHNYGGMGPYNVTLTATSENGCIHDTIRVVNTIFAEPQAAFNWPATVCLGSPAQFTDASTAPGSSVTQWSWNFGDGNTSTLQNPSHTYAAPGPYTVTLNVTSAVGCSTVNNSASHVVNVVNLPNANASGTITVCQNAPSPTITFTGSGGTPPYTFTYNINGGAPQTVSSGASSSATVLAPTATPGTFTYNLVSVQEGSTAGCIRTLSSTATVTVSPSPTATISGTVDVCLNAPSPVITFTGANGVAPYTFNYRINGGPIQTVTTVSGNSVTVAVPTTAVATFIYTLVSVQESSPNLCSQPQTGTATVNVRALPTATISGTAEVCRNSAGPVITFTGANGTAPFTFTYRVNGGTPLTVVSSGSSATVTASTTAAGVFTYELLSVQESSLSCSQNQTGTAVITVNELPTAGFNELAPVCETQSISFNDASIANAGNLSSWSWNFGDPGSGANNTSTLQNPTHVFATAGTYTVTLTVTTDKGCTSTTFQKPITVNARPDASFQPPVACINDNASFTDNSTPGGTITAWAWTFNDPNASPPGNPNTSTAQNPTHQYTVAGSYTAQLIITNSNGCVDTTTRTFRINDDITSANFTVVNTAPLCSDGSVTITDASVFTPGDLQRLEIYWEWPNTTIVTIDNTPIVGETYTHSYPRFTTPATRNYTVRYVGYTGTNCVNEVIRDITLLAMPDLAFGPVPGVCSDAPAFQITQAQLLNGLPGTGTFTGPGVSPTGMFDPRAAGAGSHTITYTFVGSNGCSEDISQVIEVYPTPALNAGPDKVVLEGGSVTLTPALNVGVPVSYLWTPPTFLNNPTLSNVTVVAPTQDMLYTLTVTTEFGCVDSDDVFVKLLKDPVIPNIFSPNGDGIHDRWEIDFLETYPGCVVQIYNRYGQMVHRIVNYTVPWDGKINGKDAPVGTYYYIIDPKNGRKPMTGFVDIVR